MIKQRDQFAMKKGYGMTKRMRFWTGLGAAALSGAVAGESAAFDIAAHHLSGKPITLAQASGEGGEGGESGGGSGVKEVGHISYLTNLGLVEGHMRAGIELYKKGDSSAARTHMKHPADELYADLKPQFESMKIAGFDAELEAVAKAVENAAPEAAIDASFVRLQAAIAKARGSVSAHDTAETVEHLVRKAADEYAIGVKDGKVNDPHEYQDAWGFVQAARSAMAAMPDDQRQKNAPALAEIEAELERVQVLWPDITGATPVTGDTTLLAAAASRIELAIQSIK